MHLRVSNDNAQLDAHRAGCVRARLHVPAALQRTAWQPLAALARTLARCRCVAGRAASSRFVSALRRMGAWIRSSPAWRAPVATPTRWLLPDCAALIMLTVPGSRACRTMIVSASNRRSRTERAFILTGAAPRVKQALHWRSIGRLRKTMRSMFSGTHHLDAVCTTAACDTVAFNPQLLAPFRSPLHYAVRHRFASRGGFRWDITDLQQRLGPQVVRDRTFTTFELTSRVHPLS